VGLASQTFLSQELQKFSRHIVQGFLHMSASNPLMFVELLFWKTSRDCYELEMGYGTTEREK
jgi:timeless